MQSCDTIRIYSRVIGTRSVDTAVHLKICSSSIKMAAHTVRMANVPPSGHIDFRLLVNSRVIYYRNHNEF